MHHIRGYRFLYQFSKKGGAFTGITISTLSWSRATDQMPGDIHPWAENELRASPNHSWLEAGARVESRPPDDGFGAAPTRTRGGESGVETDVSPEAMTGTSGKVS